MSAPLSPGRRLRINRLEVDLRGVAPATARTAAAALGPALAAALASRRGMVVPSERIDAGCIASPASPDAHTLAAGIAQRIAHHLRRGGA